MSISSAPFQFFTCVCPYPAHTSLDIDVELQAFVFPVTLIKWLLLLEIPKWQHRLVITTQDSKPVQRKTTFSDGIHLHFKVLLSQMGLCHPLLPHLFHSGFVWFLVINIKKTKRQDFSFYIEDRNSRLLEAQWSTGITEWNCTVLFLPKPDQILSLFLLSLESSQ